MKYIRRTIEGRLLDLSGRFPSLAVTGPRQAGKSTLLKNTFPNYKYVTLDDPVIREQAFSDPRFFLDSIGEKVIIDEIQLAPGILSYIKIEIDNNRQKKGIYIFTGSQQFSMIKDLGDSLAGRIALIELLPFSVEEIKRSKEMNTTLDCFVNAALTGSFPELATDLSVSPGSWYGSYIQTYLERDIRSIYNIGNLRDFQRFLQLLAARCAQILNLSAFANELGVSVPTVKNWLSILEACRIIYLLPPYYNNLGKRIIKAPKVYFLDIGMVCYLTGIKDREHLLKGPMAGALFENFCLQETVKYFFNLGVRPGLYYLRTSNKLEVDLLIELSARSILPVEIKLSKTPSPAMGANIAGFRKLFSLLDINIMDGLVVSLTDKTMPLSRGLMAVTFDGYIRRLEELV